MLIPRRGFPRSFAVEPVLVYLKNSTFNEHQAGAQISKYVIYDVQTF